MPLPGFRIIKTDTVISSKPQVTVRIFNDTIHLVVDQRLLVSDRMFYPVIAWVAIVAHSYTYGIICQPDTVFIIHIDIINAITVHSIIFIVVSNDVWSGVIWIHVHFEYSCTVCGNEKFFVIQRFNGIDADISETFFGLTDLFGIHVIYENTTLEGSYV